MPSRELELDGWINIASDDYVEESWDDEADDSVERPVPGIDDIVVPVPRVTFTLDYPFDRPFHGEIIGDRGITFRQIIDAVRRGFREMYRGATHEPIPGLINQRVNGTYGQAMHAIDDLVIEGIVFHEEEAQLEIIIGS